MLDPITGSGLVLMAALSGLPEEWNLRAALAPLDGLTGRFDVESRHERSTLSEADWGRHRAYVESLSAESSEAGVPVRFHVERLKRGGYAHLATEYIEIAWPHWRHERMIRIDGGLTAHFVDARDRRGGGRIEWTSRPRPNLTRHPHAAPDEMLEGSLLDYEIVRRANWCVLGNLPDAAWRVDDAGVRRVEVDLAETFRERSVRPFDVPLGMEHSLGEAHAAIRSDGELVHLETGWHDSAGGLFARDVITWGDDRIPTRFLRETYLPGTSTRAERIEAVFAARGGDAVRADALRRGVLEDEFASRRGAWSRGEWSLPSAYIAANDAAELERGGAGELARTPPPHVDPLPVILDAAALRDAARPIVVVLPEGALAAPESRLELLLQPFPAAGFRLRSAEPNCVCTAITGTSAEGGTTSVLLTGGPIGPTGLSVALEWETEGDPNGARTTLQLLPSTDAPRFGEQPSGSFAGVIVDGRALECVVRVPRMAWSEGARLSVTGHLDGALAAEPSSGDEPWITYRGALRATKGAPFGALEADVVLVHGSAPFSTTLWAEHWWAELGASVSFRIPLVDGDMPIELPYSEALGSLSTPVAQSQNGLRLVARQESEHGVLVLDIGAERAHGDVPAVRSVFDVPLGARGLRVVVFGGPRTESANPRAAAAH